MPKPFVPLSLPQFRQMLAKFPFTRTITAVHMHHTFHPNHSEYRGLASIEAIHQFHTRERRFSDIAQHITIAPDGTIWTGRNWDKPPASAAGNNGNAHAGPFMFEMIGDFDEGKDVFENPQRNTALQVIAAVQQRFQLSPESLRFHSHMSQKSCPGSAIDFNQIVVDVQKLHAIPSEGSRESGDAPFSVVYSDDQLTGSERIHVEAAIETLLKPVEGGGSLPEEEPPEEEDLVFTGRGGMTTAAARGTAVTAGDLIALRAHVINFNQGMLTQNGDYFTLPEDVERIFTEDMERAFADPQSVGMPLRDSSEPFRLMIWAHGGLINERDGLAIARKHLEFWKRNGIYPIYFVWETGLFESLGAMLSSLSPSTGEARNFFSDKISDPLIEGLARAVHAEKIWSSMKRNAELASSPQGGATQAAEALKAFCNRHTKGIEIHCAGHSAGSIFLAHFLPVALKLAIPAVSGLYLLAPAIRIDSFKEHLYNYIGKEVQHLGVFTMLKEHELNDSCANVYCKSLLYLIRFSLEKDRSAEILGLEECLRRDRDVANLLGLNNASSHFGNIVFSQSVSSDGQFASQSISHGGFDDDSATMNSIVLRILSLQTKAGLNMAYPETSVRAITSAQWIAPEVEELHRSFGSTFAPTGQIVSFVPNGSSSPPANVPSTQAQVMPIKQGGRRVALCIGIDRYSTRPLAGCVADARLWERTLQGLGFRCELLLDGDATYSNIKSRAELLVLSAQPGDVIVWQYAGHGTRVPDVNGDEVGGDSPGFDEAICPVDMHSGRMLTDDEIGSIIQPLRPGVSFTMLMDCCHSGSLNRFGVGEPPKASRSGDERSRFLPLTPELEKAYLEFAHSSPARMSKANSRSSTALEQTNEVLFTACTSIEVAWESNGQGEFTARATRLLNDQTRPFTNEGFINALIASFGAGRRQTPTIACAAALRNRQLFQAADEGPVRTTKSEDSMGTKALHAAGRFGVLADAIEGIAQQLRKL